MITLILCDFDASNESEVKENLAIPLASYVYSEMTKATYCGGNLVLDLAKKVLIDTEIWLNGYGLLAEQPKDGFMHGYCCYINNALTQDKILGLTNKVDKRTWDQIRAETLHKAASRFMEEYDE